MKNRVLDTDERIACRVVIRQIIEYQPQYSTPTYVTQKCVERLGLDWRATRNYVSLLIQRGFLEQNEGIVKGFPVVLRMHDWENAY